MQFCAHCGGTFPTPAQSRVLLLVAEGEPDKTIARRLAVRPTTVKAHISHMLHATGAPNRLSLVLWSMAHGIISLPELVHPEQNGDTVAIEVQPLVRLKGKGSLQPTNDQLWTNGVKPASGGRFFVSEQRDTIVLEVNGDFVGGYGTDWEDETRSLSVSIPFSERDLLAALAVVRQTHE